MNLTQLRYFLKTAETLNFSRAAEELLVARQSLRQSITALEEEIGKPLFVNDRNHLSLTEYGAYLSVAGQEAVRAFEEMENGLRRLITRSSRLNMGFSVALAPFILPNVDGVLRTFRSHFPGVDLQMTQMTNDEVIKAVEEGRLDAGFALQMPCERPGCRMLTLERLDVALDHSSPSPFGGSRYVDAEALSGIPCLGMGTLPVTMRPLWEHCRQRGIEFPYHVVSDALDAFYQLKHSRVVVFDILKTAAPGFSWDRTTVLNGFSWEVGLLCSSRCREQALLTMFFGFMQQEHENRRVLLEKDYRASDTGLGVSEPD